MKRLKDKPFALIGVNSDTDKTELKKRMEKEKITWRSFWNGPMATDGPLATAWNIKGWPTIYVLDGKGVIRGRYLNHKNVEKLVDELLAEVKDAKK